MSLPGVIHYLHFSVGKGRGCQDDTSLQFPFVAKRTGPVTKSHS